MFWVIFPHLSAAVKCLQGDFHICWLSGSERDVCQQDLWSTHSSFIVLVWDTSFKWSRFEVRPGSNKIIQNFMISFFCLFVCFSRQILGKPFPCSMIKFGTKIQEQPVHKLPNTRIRFHNEIQLAILKTYDSSRKMFYIVWQLLYVSNNHSWHWAKGLL